MQHDLGVDRAGARRHRHALERAEPHGRVDGAAVENRGHRTAAAQVTDDEPRHGHLFRRPLHGEAVKAVTPDAPLLAPALGHGVGGRLLGERRVEGSVEHGDMRHARKDLTRLFDRDERRSVVQRRQLLQHVELALDLFVDYDRIAEAHAAVDDTVCNRLDVRGSRIE